VGVRLVKKRYSGKPLVHRARTLRREQTPSEELLWAHLRNGGLAGLKFRRQHQVGPYIADFYCASLRLVIELDGAQHAEARGLAEDVERDALMAKEGLRVLRFPNRTPWDKISAKILSLQ
jgi:very-short-patch-repair endonuclease